MSMSPLDQIKQNLREWRHNPCLMGPVSAGVLFTILLVSVVSFALKFPTILLSVLLGPILGRFQYIIEFLYPTSMGRWLHLMLIKVIQRSKHRHRNDKNRGYHSRTFEMRVEVVKDRVYIHPFAFLLDNIGYLVVCCPPPRTNTVQDLSGDIHSDNNVKVSVVDENEQSPIVAFVVDCGDADAVVEQLDLISKVHYKKRSIQIQSILSTHKHHDHTAGNKALLAHDTVGKSIKLVFGGAVEKVPCCNFPLANGELLPLPKDGDNDMNDVIQVEAIATPGHTRGSLAYALRPLEDGWSTGSAFVFTGDTMFSAGSGVPFEADYEKNQDEKANRMTPTSYIKTNASNHAVEQCFAEILARCVGQDEMYRTSSDRVLIFPGHEYTSELLSRQLTQTTGESCRWKNFAPAAFFETVSQLYVSSHRRSLPHSSGKLLSAPSSLRRELLINPQLRSLQKRGEVVIRAILLWHRHFANEKVEDPPELEQNGHSSSTTEYVQKGISTHSRWNLDANNIDSSVFTTVYAAELESIIADLDSGNTTTKTAAWRLKQMKTMLDIPAIGRRPIPDTIPSDRTIYKGILGFALLGSAPSALTLSDSKAMKMPPPVVSSSDRIRVSKKRLISVLYWLGLLTEDPHGNMIVAMIHQLWKETKEYSENIASFDPEKKENGIQPSYATAADVESSKQSEDDQVELGALRWTVYGIPQQPPSFLSKYCMPCVSPVPPDIPKVAHPIELSGMQQNAGELVRHDIFTCPLCRSAAGCPVADGAEELLELDNTVRPVLQKMTSTRTDGDDDLTSIEVTPQALEAFLQEA